MDQIGAFTPEQARLLWQDFLTRRQQNYTLTANYPIRKPIYEEQTHRVFVKNTEAEAIPPYACMRVTGVATVGEQTVITVEKPSSTDGEFLFNSQFEIPVENTANGVFGIGWAYRYGVVIMLGEPPTAASVTYGPQVDSWEVIEGSGPFVVYGVHDADDRGLIGRFAGGAADVYVVLDEDLPAATAGAALTSPGQATASVYEINGSGDLADTGNNIEVYNYFEHIEVLSGTLGVAKMTSGRWRLASADCSPLT